jgi:HD-GYP domain-containing protein (c-di-GMP phosphodiesterase class II)
MTSDQAWRPKLTADEALAELQRCSGTQFDPAVVTALVEDLGGSDGMPVVVGA